MTTVQRARALRSLAVTMGVVCGLIGVVHVVFGSRAVPGEDEAVATVDSQERFFGAIFLGYGLGWLWVGRQAPVPAQPVRFLAGIFALGAAGRAISVVDRGWPHRFQIVLGAIEVVLPPVFWWLANADEVAAGHDPSVSEHRSPTVSIRQRAHGRQR